MLLNIKMKNLEKKKDKKRIKSKKLAFSTENVLVTVYYEKPYSRCNVARNNKIGARESEILQNIFFRDKRHSVELIFPTLLQLL